MDLCDTEADSSSCYKHRVTLRVYDNKTIRSTLDPYVFSSMNIDYVLT